MKQQNVTAVVILDLSAAFDTVDHNQLLYVLNKRFSISEHALQWYEQYLKPRKFKVVINNQYSTTKTMDFSIPQGSVQGVYLFIAYASAIQDIINDNLTLNGFADDHSTQKPFRTNQITSTGTTDEHDTITMIEKSMLNIKAWMDTVRFKLNESKTEYIHFGSRQELT